MQIERADPDARKGWCFGERIAEIYIVARGTSRMRVEQETIVLPAEEAKAERHSVPRSRLGL